MLPWLGSSTASLFRHVRLAARQLVAGSSAPLLIVLLFALACGVGGGMWAVVDAVLLRPLPYRDPDQVVVVLESHPQRGSMAMTPGAFFDWSQRTTSMVDTAGFSFIDASVAGQDRPVRVPGQMVTGRYFEVLGAAPALGHVLSAADVEHDNRRVVISHRLWTTQFGRSPGAIGTTLLIDGQPYAVAAVMARDFRTPGNAALWIPWHMSAQERADRRFHLVGAIGRLRSGRTAEAATAELRSIYRQLESKYPSTNEHWSAAASPVRDALLGNTRYVLGVLGASVSIFVAVAVANVVGLLLGWLPSRQREFSTRLAIGATSRGLFGQILVETFTWAVLGMLGGLGIAYFVVELFSALSEATRVPFDFAPRLDERVVMAMTVLLVALVALAVSGPAAAAIGAARRQGLPRRGRTTRGILQKAIAASQVAVAAVSLVLATALILSVRHLDGYAVRSTDESTLAAEVSLSEIRYPTEVSQRQFFERLMSGLALRRELASVAAASYVPPADPLGNVRFAIEGDSRPSDETTAIASAITPAAFRVLGLGLRSGRFLDERDQSGTPAVAVISASLARRYWGNQDPLNRRITLAGTTEPMTIVGVVNDVAQPLSTAPQLTSVLYMPYQQTPWPFMTVLVKPTGEEAAALEAVRSVLAQIDPAQALGPARRLADVRTEWLRLPRLRTILVGSFGLATLLLTLVGVYARMSHDVALRSQEFGIRMAVGATAAQLTRRLTVDSLGVIAVGILAGLALAPLALLLLRRMTATGPIADATLLGAVALMMAVAGAASAYLPARRVRAVSVIGVLKAD
jgi:putative ABC transport system permease protein